MRFDGVDVTITLSCARTGRMIRSNTTKRSAIAYCVDESDRRVLVVGRDEKSSQDFPVAGGVQVITRFVHEGKATLIVPKRGLTLFLQVDLSQADELGAWCRALTSGRPTPSAAAPGAGPAKRPLAAQRGTPSRPSRPPLSSRSPSSANGPSPAASVAPKKASRSRESPSWRSPVALSPGAQQLTEEQQGVLKEVLRGASVFFTGGAGVGKSYLLRQIVSRLPPATTFVTASTGMAACQVGGVTIHHWAGIGGGDRPLSELVDMARRKRGQQWRSAKTLVIDEISMLDGDLFDKLDAVARRVRANPRPFGGLQLVLCGDFFQLPPVAKAGASFRFAFEAEAWARCVHSTFELTEVFRQSDPAFISALRQIRVGRCAPEAEALLRSCVRRELPDVDGIAATRLFTHKEDCLRLNELKLKELPGPQATFLARDSSADESALATLRAGCAAPAEVKLKPNAQASGRPCAPLAWAAPAHRSRRQPLSPTRSQVILTKTLDAEGGLVNGARGVVVRFLSTGHPLVRFLSGVEKTMRMEAFPLTQGGQVIACRMQLPLAHGWALSVHKSQGMTLDRVEMSLARVFECGQMYVALSRARALEGLSLANVDFSKLRAHPKVLAWHEEMVSAGITRRS